MKPQGHVVLLRSSRDDDPYERAFREAGYEVRCHPVLAFEFVRTDELRQRLERPDNYDGLICTSPRAARALAGAAEANATVLASWSERPAYAVGPRTAEALRALGLSPVGHDAGDAETLAAYIATRSYDRRLLFLSGNRRRDVLPETLKRAGVVVDELCVYRTALRDEVGWEDGPVDWLVFFSPSGVEAVEPSSELSRRGIRLAAIGPTTARALQEVGLHVDAVAEVPEPEALVRAVARVASSALSRRDNPSC